MSNKNKAYRCKRTCKQGDAATRRFNAKRRKRHRHRDMGIMRFAKLEPFKKEEDAE